MKKRISLLVTIFCALFAMGAGYLLCENKLLKQDAEYTEYRFPLQDIQVVDAEETAEGLLTGADPQLIMTEINDYIETVVLQDMVLQETIQIYYTETAGESFSEEKSIVAVPETENSGSSITINKQIADLRIDFMGAEGSLYNVGDVVLNPTEYLEWGFGVAVFSGLLGAMVGVCLFFLVTEGKNFRVYVQALKKYRFLLEDMVVRDIKLKYRRSVIGLLWSVLNPLLMMIVITAVFQNLFRFEIENFAVYYLTGWLVFNFVTEATTGAMTSVIGAAALIRKVYIPKYIFPIQKCIFSFVNMLFSLVALLAVMLVLNVKFTPYILLIPIPLLLALVFAIGISMILSTAAVFLRDMIHLYGIFTMVWMYLTPIIYPEEILVGAMQTVMKLNPMYYYVDSFRQLTLYGTMPGADTLVVMCICSAISLVLGVAVFKKKQDRFVLYI